MMTWKIDRLTLYEDILVYKAMSKLLYKLGAGIYSCWEVAPHWDEA